MDMENRREYERFGSDMIFWIKPLDSDEEFAPFDIENISAGGILARTSQPFVQGSHVMINFELPQWSDLICAEAEVRHLHPTEEGVHRIGLQFVRVHDLDQERLTEFLEELFK